MAENPIPENPQDSGDGGGQDNIARPQAAIETVEKESRRQKAKRYANAAETKLEIAFVFIRGKLGSSEFWTALATVVMAITTIAYTIYARRQWKEMQGSGKQTDRLLCLYQQQLAQLTKQVGDTHELAERTKDLAGHMKDQADRTKTIAEQATVQADANKRLAQNAVDALGNTKQSFRDERRAWVGVQGLSDSKGFSATEPWKITVIFFNSGRTPAKNVQASGMYITSPISVSGPAPQQVSQLTFRPVQSVAPQGFYREAMGATPGAQGASSIEIQGQNVLVSQYLKIKNKELFLYYFGLLKYDDIDGKSRETQFCVLLADPDTREAGMCDSFNDLY
jgi:hypothetical protein